MLGRSTVSAKAIHYRKGDVVLVSFPYTTDEGTLQTRRRPAVIVSNDYNNARLDDVLTVPITSNTKNNMDRRTVVVSMSSPEGKAAGLRLDSVIDCTIIATIPKTLLVNRIGRFSDEIIKRIDECIRRGIDPDEGLGAGVPLKPFPFDDDSSVALELPDQQSDESEDVDKP